MPRRPTSSSTRPRKSARQTRAQVTVDAILEAAARLFADGGLERVTTTRIADLAGVSVGSLYQYFPNKEAVLAELARRLERRTRAQLVEILRSSTELPLDATAARVVDAMLDGIGGLAFRRALLQEVPSAWKDDTSDEVDAEMRQHVRDLLASRRDVRGGEHQLMAWVIAHAVEGVVEATVRAAPELVALPEFRAELIELARRYLTV